MTQRKEEFNFSTTSYPTLSVPNNDKCWWKEEVLSNPGSVPPYNDFVLISEFSELEGPLPLAIVMGDLYIDLKHYTDKIPNKGDNTLLEEELKKIGLASFDFNAFVLRVVSVDRSTEYDEMNEEVVNPISPISLLEETETSPFLFSIPDDTQVYFTDSEYKFFAFTHHLTLFDINARGYVHPVALSYIARDPNKIISQFEELMEKFNEVSVKMKQGNYSNFILDLKCRLLDLKYTQSLAKPSDCKPPVTLQAFHQAITATQLMIDTLESSISQLFNINTANDTDNLSDNSNILSTSEHTHPILSNRSHHIHHPSQQNKAQYSIDPPKDYKPNHIDTLYPIAHFERKLRSLAQLCQEPNEMSEETSYANIPPTTTVIPLVFSMIEPQPTISTNQRTSFSKAISHDMYSEAIVYLQDMTYYFGQNSVVLDICDDDESFIEPIPSAITIGRTFMLNVENPKPREIETKENDKAYTDTSSKQPIISEKDTPFVPSEHYYPIVLAPTKLWKSQSLGTQDIAKLQLLDMMRRYKNVISNIVFSIMTGHTMIIQGNRSNKNLIIQVVQSLCVFVPGQHKQFHRIIEWYEADKLTDSVLKGIKLVGVDADRIDASVYNDRNCILDVDKISGSLYSSPVHVKGKWLEELLGARALFTSNEAYLAYLHTIFMAISLKAFVYHHIKKMDGFKMEDIPPSDLGSNRGYTSESNSESSATSRKWSFRFMNYIKKKDREGLEDGYTSQDTDDASTTGSMTEKEDYSDENQATITLHNIQQVTSQQATNQPRSLAGLFEELSKLNQENSASNGTRRSSVATNYSRRTSLDSEDDMAHSMTNSFLDEKEDIGYCEQDSTADSDDGNSIYSNNGSVSGRVDQDPVRLPGEDASCQMICALKKKSIKQSRIGSDGLSAAEKRARKYLQDKFKICGDEQRIIMYLASIII